MANNKHVHRDGFHPLSHISDAQTHILPLRCSGVVPCKFAGWGQRPLRVQGRLLRHTHLQHRHTDLLWFLHRYYPVVDNILPCDGGSRQHAHRGLPSNLHKDAHTRTRLTLPKSRLLTTPLQLWRVLTTRKWAQAVFVSAVQAISAPSPSVQAHRHTLGRAQRSRALQTHRSGPVGFVFATQDTRAPSPSAQEHRPTPERAQVIFSDRQHLV